MTTGGAVESLQALRRGRAQLALTTVDTLAQAVNGEGPFAGSTVSARTIGTLYVSRLHLVVPDSSPIRGFSQLRTRRVALGAPVTGTHLTASRALGSALLEGKVQATSSGLVESLSEMAAGRLDAVFWLDGVPSPLLERSAAEQGATLRLLNNASVVPLLQRRHGLTLYETAEIPAGMYGSTELTGSVGVPTVLVSRHDLPDVVAHNVAQSVLAARPAFVSACPGARGLKLEFAARSSPAAMHPGAARFYRQSSNSTP